MVQNLYQNSAMRLDGPFVDIEPVTPHDTNPLPVAGLLRAGSTGTITGITQKGQLRTITAHYPGEDILVVFTHVHATGTTVDPIEVYVPR